ncbi:MAG: ABC transporter substrate-binding protein [Clostridia bacterium]|nr:ABC transporter substrate-binding protein [Clostridia bacterium]MBQ6506136.1 ABC transporter substrate-binding protein [Clostridia bacterium]MBR0386440.1 ABC transporter substrate-binding protein [Clostridia bacterium]MBR2601826.1 ABC transporter substrate-binding protein [Clostridia bacterium]MBR7173463.1 ABC transporter substrate-binding protein [Clostridia bacterium]
MKKLFAVLLTAAMLLSLASFASAEGASGKVMLYSSMQEAQLQAIEQAFEAKYPGVDMEYYYAGGGKLVTKMTTEAQDGGQIASDLVWLGDPSDYEVFKKNGWLEPYVSPETDHIAKEYMDPEGYYTAGRLVTMGIAWFIGVDEADAPKTWNDLLDPKWQGQIIMTDPAQASTTKYWMAAMMQSEKYGPEFFKKLRENGVELESGTTATHNRVADASYQVGICLDYVSANLIAEGSPMAFHYTTEDVITMTSPVAIIKGCANPDNAKLLMDFILSKEGQEVLVANNLVSVRDDVEMQVDTSAIAAINMPVDYTELGENLQGYLDQFNEIFGK